MLAGVMDNLNAQQGVRVQHIVVDGGSTDGTVDLLRSRHNEGMWVSEPDGGQAHALNKGFAMADADIFGWLNCDDRLTPGALALVVQLFNEAPETEFLYGDALGCDLSGRSYGPRTHVSQCDFDSLVRLGDPIVQPAAFWTREIWERVGGLYEAFDYAFDYEFWMRVAAITPLKYVPICFALESRHGKAKTSTGGLARISEIETVARLHGGNGLPLGFHAEASVLKSVTNMKALMRRDSGAMKAFAREVRAMKPGKLRHAASALVHLVPGNSTVPRLQLFANRVRSRRFAPTYPTQLVSVPKTWAVEGTDPAKADG